MVVTRILLSFEFPTRVTPGRRVSGEPGMTGVSFKSFAESMRPVRGVLDNPVDNPGDGSKSANENNDLIFFGKIVVNSDFNQFHP